MQKRNICLFVCALFILSAVAPAFAQGAPELSLVTTTGSAEVFAVPDEVVMTLGVETWNQDLSLAKQENDQIVRKIIAMARKYEIEDKYIQTDRINIEPRYNRQREHKQFIGFFVRKNISVTLRDTAKFENFLSDMLTAGTNNVYGVDFRTTQLREYKKQARALAIKRAKEKAVALAEELGQKVGRAHMIQEGGSSFSSTRRNKMVFAQAVMEDSMAGSAGGTTVPLGQIEIRASVTVSFELE